MNNLRPYTYSEPINGVRVKPMSEDGKRINILYHGLLVESGADNVTMHAGFGDTQSWHNVNNFNMQRSNMGFEISMDVQDKQLNFCFKDSINNWDNNSGQNWIYRIY